MDGINFNGSPDCRQQNVATNYGNPKLAGCSLLSPLSQWPPKHQTATTASSSTISRISSGLLRSSDGALTSTASVKALQSPSLAAPTVTPASNTSVPPKGPASTTKVFPSSTNYSTATLISIASTQSNIISKILPAPTSSPTRVTAAPAIISLATASASRISLSSSGPQASSAFSSDQFMTVTGLANIVTPTIQAAAQQTSTQPAPFTDTNMSRSPQTDMVIGLVVGIILGVIFIILPATYYVYRRRSRKQAHRRSIGAIEADRMFRPWKKAENDLKRRTANMQSLYFPLEKGSELAMPPPVFAPLRPNRSSSMYSGSFLAGIERLIPQTPVKTMEPIMDRNSFESDSTFQGSPFDDEKRSSSRFSGYIYSDNPFEAPLIAPERPESVVIIRKLPKQYKGKIKFGMGVQRDSFDLRR